MARLSKPEVYRIIFEADTPAGKWFDVILLYLIVISILVMIIESVPTFAHRFEWGLDILEWVITGLFTVEYGLRLWCAPKPWRYARSFFGVVDLLAILPSYLGLVLVGVEYLLIIRVLRLLRVFRVLKMIRYVGEAATLMTALRASSRKILVFLFAVLNIVLIVGTLMYLIEGPENGFTSIPKSMYWTIVTMTTVGYGDITPHTLAGQILASVLMILGYGIIAVPTGIVSVELSQASHGGYAPQNRQLCTHCQKGEHAPGARYCDSCGTALGEAVPLL